MPLRPFWRGDYPRRPVGQDLALHCMREGRELSTARKFSLEELRDPWVLLYEIGHPSGGPIPFPAALNHREVDRAARAIIAGRSPGVRGWLNKRITELATLGVERGAARRDVDDLKAAIESRIIRIRLMEGGDEE